MTLYAPQIDLPSGAYAPDAWRAGDVVCLPLQHVVSRDADGQPLSRAGDFVWDLSCYRIPKKISRLPFWYWRNSPRVIQQCELSPDRIARIREMQYLMLLRMYRSERPTGFVQLRALKGILDNLAWFAEERRSSLLDVLNNAKNLDEYIVHVPSAKAHVLMIWLRFLQTMDPKNDLGFELAKPRLWGELLEKAKRYRESQTQHAPLPTRIYLQLIQSLGTELLALETHWPRIEAAIREAAVLHKAHLANANKMSASFGPELIRRHSVEGILIEYGCDLSSRGLTAMLVHIQRLAKLQIHVFSGMRDREAQYLPYHCMDLQRAGHGRRTAWIRGVTTKLSGGRAKRTGWVTTEDQGFRAIRFAQKVAGLIYEILGVSPSAKESDKNEFPLFVSTANLPWNNRDADSDYGHLPNQNLHLKLLPESVKNKLYGVIGAEDLDELEAINPFRDWATEPAFEVGSRWHIKTHQLRRSLALYANASGLVKSSSLRRQLQHITNEMGYYYGRGSLYAKNFLKEDPDGFREHIAIEWQDCEQEAQYLSFTRDVLNSDEPLHGPAGIFYDLLKQRGEVMAESEVQGQLKAGRMAYKSHPLGGCTNVGICNKQKGLRLTSGICVSEACKSLIGKHSKIIKLIPVQRNVVAHLDPDSIVYQMEKEELEILEEAEARWRQSSMRKDNGDPVATLAQLDAVVSRVPEIRTSKREVRL